MQTDPPNNQLQAITQELRELRDFKTTSDNQIRSHDARLLAMETQLRTLVDVDEEQKLREKVQELDNRLNELKDRLGSQRKGCIRRAGRWLWEFIKSNWTFLAFVVSVGSIGYVYYEYGISYFESFKTLANTKNSAKSYKETGDALLERAEFKAADEAYQSAVAIDPSYSEARQSLMRTQILNSLDSYSAYTPVPVEAKLTYLENASQDDYLIPYIRGVIQIDHDRKNEARELFIDSLKKNKEFVGNYIQLGYLDLFAANIDRAKANFSAALTKVPDHPLALYNLGLCHMLSLDFDSAIKTMERAASYSDRLEIFLSLGEAYRNIGRTDMAVFHHERARKLIEDPNLKVGANYGRGTFNFFPENRSDEDTPKIFVQALTINNYKALINYELSIDYALQRKFSDAKKSFVEGYKADETINGEKGFGCFYLNRSDFVIRRQNLSPVISRWFSKKRSVLDRNRTCAL